MELLQIIGGILAWRIRGGMGNSLAQKLLRKPAEWEIPNTYIRLICAAYFALLLPLAIDTPIYIGLFFVGVVLGYFGGEFNLALKENRTWQNYLRLALRGGFVCLPALTYAVLSLSPNIYPLLYGVAFGLLLPACYLIGFALPEKKGVISHSQIAEAIFGGILAWGILWIS
jgi:hypothetical protein